MSRSCTSIYRFDLVPKIIICTHSFDKNGIIDPCDFSKAEIFFLSEDFNMQSHLLQNGDDIMIDPSFLLSRTIRNKEKKIPVSLSYSCEDYLLTMLKKEGYLLNNHSYFGESKTTAAQQVKRVSKNICDELRKYHDEDLASTLMEMGKDAFFENYHGSYRLKIRCVCRFYDEYEKKKTEEQHYVFHPLVKEIRKAFYQEKDIVALCGMSGNGKSTLAMYYCQRYQIRNVYLLDFSSYQPSSSLKDLSDYPFYFNGHLFKEKETIKNILKAQDDSAVLIIDGMNMVSSQLLTLLEKVYCRIIITSILPEENLKEFLSKPDLPSEKSDQVLHIPRFRYKKSSVISLDHFPRQKEFARSVFFQILPFSRKYASFFDELLKPYFYHTKLSNDLAQYIIDETIHHKKLPDTVFRRLADETAKLPGQFLGFLVRRFKTLPVKCRELLGAIIEIDSHACPLSFLKEVVSGFDEKDLKPLIDNSLIEQHDDILQMHDTTRAALMADSEDSIVLFKEETSLSIFQQYFLNNKGKTILTFLIARKNISYIVERSVLIIRHDVSKLAVLINAYTHTGKQKTAGIGDRLFPEGSVLNEMIVHDRRYLLLYRPGEEEEPFLLLQNEFQKFFFYDCKMQKCYPRFFPYEKPSEHLTIIGSFGCFQDRKAFPKVVEKRGILDISPAGKINRIVFSAVINISKMRNDISGMNEWISSCFEDSIRDYQNCPTEENCRFFIDVMEERRNVNAFFYDTMDKKDPSGLSLMEYSYCLLDESISLYEYGVLQSFPVGTKKEDIIHPQLHRNYSYYAMNRYREKKYDQAAAWFFEAKLEAKRCQEKDTEITDWDDRFAFFNNMFAKANAVCDPPLLGKYDILHFFIQACTCKRRHLESIAGTHLDETLQDQYATLISYRLDLLDYQRKIGISEAKIQRSFDEIGAIVGLLSVNILGFKEDWLLKRANTILRYYNERLNYEIHHHGNRAFIRILLLRGQEIIDREDSDKILDSDPVTLFKMIKADYLENDSSK